MDRPVTQYAWNGESALAYQALGEGPTDLVYRQGWSSNLEWNWEHPTMARFLRRLAQGRRLIMTDPRGTGLSERASPRDVWPLETNVDDLTAVLEAVGSERCAILASLEQCFVACMFAATYPARTSALVLYEATATFIRSEQNPWEWAEEDWDRQEVSLFETTFTRAGVEQAVREMMPSKADDATFLDWWYRYGLFSESPGHVYASVRKYRDTDIRPILPSIHVPTLILLRPRPEPFDWGASGRDLAARIPGARLAEIRGRDEPLWLGEQDALHRIIDGFLADVRREREEIERVLATVLVVDVVDSTSQVASLGDARWRDLLGRHRADVRALLERFRGDEVDTAGDGFLATFDGPARAIRCALAIVADAGRLGIEVRIGVHTGECELIEGKVGGLAVHIGARIAALSGPSQVLASQTVRDLVVGSGLTFEEAGEHELKGVPDRWRLFRAVG